MIRIVIPAWNEALRIGPTLRDYAGYDVLVVDDGSTDDTAEVARAHGARVLSLPHAGKGHAVRAGMLQPGAAIRVMVDADGSTPADQLPALLDALEDVAIGSRRLPDSVVEVPQGRRRRTLSRVAGSVIRATVLPGVRDPYCGFKAFTAPAAEAVFPHVRSEGWAFDVEVLALARRRGLRIAEVPVRWADDAASRGRMRDLPGAAAELVRIATRRSS